MEKKVLTQEEIDKIKKLKDQFEDLTITAGNIEIQIMNFQLQKDQIKSNLQQLQQQEKVIAQELEKKYGDGTISLESGEFLPKG
jgi:predicted  nucleic acid-binding Zn-ribbon protein